MGKLIPWKSWGQGASVCPGSQAHDGSLGDPLVSLGDLGNPPHQLPSPLRCRVGASPGTWPPENAHCQALEIASRRLRSLPVRGRLYDPSPWIWLGACPPGECGGTDAGGPPGPSRKGASLEGTRRRHPEDLTHSTGPQLRAQCCRLNMAQSRS